jgi:hypothetical protein
MTDLTTLRREATAKAVDFAQNHPVAKKAKDAVFTAVGLGITSTQRAAKAVRTAPGTVDTDGLHESVRKTLDDVTTSLKRGATKLDSAVAPIEHLFPAALRDITKTARQLTSHFTKSDATSEAAGEDADTK